jgi:hypothetical protein
VGPFQARIRDFERSSSQLVGSLLGCQLRLEVPTCLEPLFTGVCGPPIISPRSLALRARHKGGVHWAVDYGPTRKFAEVSGLNSIHYALDKALIMELQRQRPDLLFMHAAVLGSSRGAIAVLAASGGGKSTTSLTAIQAGLRCYSDELAPIDVDKLCVWPYRRALALKTPPCSVRFRERQLAYRIDRQWFLPLDPGPITRQGRPIQLRALVMLEQVENAHSRIFTLSTAAALASVYSHCLNPFAHANGGLPEVRRLITELPCYRLSSTHPRETLALLQELLDD